MTRPCPAGVCAVCGGRCDARALRCRVCVAPIRSAIAHRALAARSAERRETAMLMTARGQSRAEIAARLQISPETVTWYRSLARAG